ncbi:MAG: A/G-specific adenine glycosylase [Hydrogenophaga sp.]
MNPPTDDAPPPDGFARQLIAWQRRFGRHGLPWQGTRDPYRVWLSEVMLQQTQVSTVLSYYPRFLQRFPDVHALAQAHEDEVMALWSGLGYYSRARNLHRCARTVVAEHGGTFPFTAAGLETLPGIGASTAAAIAAFCHGERVSILDGNVRRVLTRVLAFEGDLAQPVQQRALWTRAQALLPPTPEGDDMAAYTQGLMDLGATVCTRSRPRCAECPMQTICRAAARGTPCDFPVKTRTLLRRHETWVLLICRAQRDAQAHVWLQRRPSRGIWAGLYCTPVHADEAQALASLPTHVWRSPPHSLAAFSHPLTHRELRLQPVLVEVDGAWTPGDGHWVALSRLGDIGLPAPLRTLLDRLPD